MYDPGYTDYKDGRLQPPDEDDTPCCGSCTYYRDVAHAQKANGMTHYIGVCIFEIFNASSLAELGKADVLTTTPSNEPCEDYREEQ